ncbi:MAG: NAD(P)H-dependent flavin oxidoreductase [Bacillota bacterium]|jgi:nitronate monooxygenase
MKVSSWRIGELKIELPIVQGGMGVGISMAGLASAVANCGGLGVVSGVETGFYRPDYASNKRQANPLGLLEQLQLARRKSPKGVIGVNIMVALNNYAEMVAAAVKGGAQVIFSGAGLPLNLPELVEGAAVKLAPIISSARAAKLMCRSWLQRYGRVPDAIVLEGPQAGGHLGFSPEQLHDSAEMEQLQLERLIPEVLEVIEPYRTEENSIPLIAGGGLWTGYDVARVLKAGASAAQLGSRFVPTAECDASEAFKQEYVRAREEDIVLIQSPVGMPGRAVKNDFLQRVQEGETKPIRCAYNCLKPCSPKQAPYCIADALINAQRGNLNSGFAFVGANAWRAEGITSVAEVFNELMSELEQA